MKVALISQNASPGLMIFRKDFIEYLVLAGHDVFLFAIDYSELTRSLVEDMGAIAVDYSLSKAGITPFKDIKDTWLLSRKLKELKVDVTFSFFIKPSIYGTIAAKIASVPRRIAMLEGLGYIHS